MRMPLDKVMEKLGVGRTLSAYETQPWFLYDEEKGITCSAEVRMGPDAQEVEAEIQFLHDEKDEEEKGEGDKGKSEGGGKGGPPSGGGPEQILTLRVKPITPDKWTTNHMFVRGEDYNNKIYDWEEKGLDFFRSCIESIQMGELPDIEALIERELNDSMFGGGRRGKIGRKSPTIKPENLLGMKKGGI